MVKDLFNAIENGDYPAWKLYVQIMPLEDANTYRFDPFDVTKVWSQKDYPLIEVGRMVLEHHDKQTVGLEAFYPVKHQYQARVFQVKMSLVLPLQSSFPDFCLEPCVRPRLTGSLFETKLL